jgi:putative radical SAM enzyme (TIGR03279 family)
VARFTALPLADGDPHVATPAVRTSAGRRTSAPERGGEVARVGPGTAAARAGIVAGDRLLAIDGVVPRDIIDVGFQTQGRRRIVVDLERDDTRRTLRVTLGGRQDLGVDFEQPTFDGIRECNNTCEFCFIRGLPKGLRRSLYIRDDDYRYSFLFGSFITLTNLDDEDWRRILFQRLSPLRVSVHATDPVIRSRLLGHPGVPPILPQLRRLAAGGVKVHAQVVLCPGLNDGPVLERTVSDLADVSEAVQSVAVVPVGISAHLRVREIRPVLPEHALATVRSVMGWNRRFRRSLGRGFVYPSDELFLMANARLPGASFYDGYPQLQNGVGLTRLLLADWRRHRSRLPGRLDSPRCVIWLCGRAARAALTEMARDLNRVENLSVEARVVENTLFGEAISVSGLMSGRDAVAALSDVDADFAVLPRSAFGHDGTRTLDDWTIPDIEQAAGTRVRLAQSAGELIRCTVG